MECLEMPVWTDFTRKELEQIQIGKPSETAKEKVQKKWDLVAKPLDGMGRFENLTAQIGAILETEKIVLSKKAVLIMCADNGIVEEGVSQSGQEVTLTVAKLMGKQMSSVGRMAKTAGTDTIPVDIGINSKETPDGVIAKKIACGTRNFYKEPAMTQKETIQAIAVGIDMVCACKIQGYQILATGEMGIGNTTTSSALTAALLRCDVEKVTGRGAGLSDRVLLHKQEIIQKSLEKYDLYHADELTILKTVGGLDIAGLVGVCIGGALCHIPIVLDGVISLTAALLAERLCPGTRAYLIPSHKGKEPAMQMLMEAMQMEPVIDGNMALGEGTGAVMLFPLLDMALSVYQNGTAFADTPIEPYVRLDRNEV